MEKRTASRFDYVRVTDLKKGDTIVNLGIINHIFQNTASGYIEIHFNPSRSLQPTNRSVSFYKKTDKLMIA